MGTYIDHMIGIRVGGVLSGKPDMGDVKKRILKVIAEMKAKEDETGLYPPDIDADENLDWHISPPLTGHKGNYVVIAGVFNYWSLESATDFAQRLSKEFQTEVMQMSWNEQSNRVECEIFLNGQSLFEIGENPVGRLLRRMGMTPKAEKELGKKVIGVAGEDLPGGCYLDFGICSKCDGKGKLMDDSVCQRCKGTGTMIYKAP